MRLLIDGKVEKDMKDKIFGVIIILGTTYSLYFFWGVILPSISSDFWRGFFALAFSLITPLYLLFAIAAFFWGVLGKK